MNAFAFSPPCFSRTRVKTLHVALGISIIHQGRGAKSTVCTILLIKRRNHQRAHLEDQFAYLFAGDVKFARFNTHKPLVNQAHSVVDVKVIYGG